MLSTTLYGRMPCVGACGLAEFGAHHWRLYRAVDLAGFEPASQTLAARDLVSSFTTDVSTKQVV